MGKKVLAIKDNLKFYATDRVTCFERPVATILENYRKFYGSYTYMFIKIIQSYEIPYENNIEYLVIDFWNRYLGISVKESLISYGLINAVKNKIEQDIPVLIMGNLIDLFYSEKYKVKNWGHLFLTTGYDEEKQLLLLLDDSHLKANTKYEPFAITEQIMEQMVTKMEWFGKTDKIYTLEKNDAFNTKKDKDILVFLLHMFLAGMEGSQFMELKHIYDIHNLLINGERNEKNEYNLESISWNFLNVIKKKGVFIDELIDHMERMEYPKELINHIQDVYRNLYYEWERFCNRELAKCLRGKKEYRAELSQDIFSAEKNLKNQIEKCIKYLEDYDILKDNRTHLIYDAENNESNIIVMDDGIIKFNFYGYEIFNSWIQDDCPKLYLQKQINKDEKHKIIKATFLIDKDFEESNFQVGLFIKTDNGEIYYGALDNNNKLVFDIFGQSNLDLQYPFQTEITLFLEYQLNELVFGIIEKGNKVSKLKRPFTPISSFDIGIACKTWGNGKKLNVNIDDFGID